MRWKATHESLSAGLDFCGCCASHGFRLGLVGSLPPDDGHRASKTLELFDSVGKTNIEGVRRNSDLAMLRTSANC